MAWFGRFPFLHITIFSFGLTSSNSSKTYISLILIIAYEPVSALYTNYTDMKLLRHAQKNARAIMCWIFVFNVNTKKKRMPNNNNNNNKEKG